MNLTFAARSPLADPRRGFASVLTVMFLVLAVLSVQAVCGVHPHEAEHSSASAYDSVGQQAAPPVATTLDDVEMAPGHHGAGSHHCAEDRPVTARYERTQSPSTDLAEVPALAAQWLVPDIRLHAPRVPSGLAVAAAPSLHALGISRT
jgi:hypothetical protein